MLCSIMWVIVLIYAKDFLLPMVIAALLSLLLYPVYKKLTEWKIPSILAVIITMLIIVALIVTTALIVSSEIRLLLADISSQSVNINAKFTAIENYVSSHLNMDADKINGLIDQAKGKLFGVGGDIASGAISSTTNFLSTVVLIIIYVFCFLLYNKDFRDFAFALLRTEKHDEATSLINHIQRLVQNYLLGLLMVIGIIGTLHSIGLALLGVNHAIFFAFFAGLLTVIPYIGISIGASLAVVYCILTKDTIWPAVGVLGVMMTVQFLESNFVTPKVVGSKVSVNPFVAIVVLIIGGELWGLPGMALSIPLTAILKLLLDSKPHTKPFGYFIGSEFTDTKIDPFKYLGKKGSQLKKEN
jgi:predicted PurR-regulated permease PerM